METNQKSLNHLRKILQIRYLTQCLNLKESTKAESQSKALVKKVKDCIAKGDYEQVKVASSDVIRQKNMVKRYRVF